MHTNPSPASKSVVPVLQAGQVVTPNRFRRSSARLYSLVTCLGVVTLLSSTSSLHAQATWTGSTDSDWNTVANWSTTPTNPSGNFSINTATGNFPVLSANSAFTPVDVIIGTATGQTGRLDHRAGTLTQATVGATGNWFKIGTAGATGTYNLADTSLAGAGVTGFAQGSGTLTIGKLFVGGGYFADGGTGTVNVNTTGTLNAQSTQNFSGRGNSAVVVGWNGGTGTLKIDNGTVNSSGLTDIAVGSSATFTNTGTVTVAGGTLNSEGDLRVGVGGTSSSQGTLNIQGGTVNVASATKRWMILGQFDSVNSQVNISSGNLNLNTNTDIRVATGNTSAASTTVINQTGGNVTFYSNNGTTVGGSGVVDMQLSGSASVKSTYNLDGGTLTTNQITSTLATGTRRFNFNGGTLKAASATNAANFINLVSGTGTARANVRNGGAKIDTNGFNITVAQALLHSDIGGDNAVDGGLTKQGSGKLTLSGVNTYTGNTTINAGTLALASTGSIANSAVIIANGTFDVSAVTGFTVGASQTLKGSGSVIGATTVNGTLAPGNSPGLLTFSNNLSLGASSTSQFEINGATRGSSFDAVDVGGTLTYGGTMSLFFNAPITAGTYDLFAGASGGALSTPSGDFGAVSISGSFAESFVTGPTFTTGTGWTASSSNWNFAFNNLNGDLTITSAVPEPSAFAALAGLVGLGLVGSRRRRR